MATEQDFEFVRQGTMEKEQNEATSTEPRVVATTDLPHDQITVQRFRESFPRARWSDTLNAWFVPGRTAERRIGRWRAEMEARRTLLPMKRAGMLSHSIRSKAAISKPRLRPFKSGHPTRALS